MALGTQIAGLTEELQMGSRVAAAACHLVSSAPLHRSAMATIIVYQKPGCANSARQIQALKTAGHDVVVKDILKQPWHADELRGFFRNMPVNSWFNRAAPRIKSGEVNPDALDAASALALMVGDPLLIRRPLIDIDGARSAGRDREPALSLIGGKTQDDLEVCLHEGHCTPCRQA